MYKIKYNNSLSHHGVLGMKWGVWNDETAARYRGGSKSFSQAKEKFKKINTQSIKKGKDKSPVSPAQEITKNTENIARSASRIIKKKEESDRKKQPKASDKMSDKELRDAINRLRMEKEYDQLTRESLNDGKMSVSDILETVGDVAAIVGGIATIVAVINGLNKV